MSNAGVRKNFQVGIVSRISTMWAIFVMSHLCHFLFRCTVPLTDITFGLFVKMLGLNSN